jgi:hypothetical protein
MTMKFQAAVRELRARRDGFSRIGGKWARASQG